MYSYKYVWLKSFETFKIKERQLKHTFAFSTHYFDTHVYVQRCVYIHISLIIYQFNKSYYPSIKNG